MRDEYKNNNNNNNNNNNKSTPNKPQNNPNGINITQKIDKCEDDEDLILKNNKSSNLFKLLELDIGDVNKNNNIDISYPSSLINPLINLIGTKLKINHNYGKVQYNTKGVEIIFDSNGYLNVKYKSEGGLHSFSSKLQMAPLTQTIKNINYSNKSNDIAKYAPRGHIIPDCNTSNYYMFSTVTDLVCT